MKDLSVKQAKAVISIVQGDKVATTAKKVGVTERTVYDWLTHAKFKQSVDDGILQIYNDAIAESVRISTDAIQFLHEVITDPEASNRDRITASREILANADKWKDKALEARIGAIEEALSNVKP